MGNGEALDELKVQISEKGLQHVRVLGFMSGEDLHRIIAGSLCTVVPSEWYDPLPTVILKSFAHGKPVIGSRIGGISELISDSVDGFLFNPGNVSDLREKILWMTTHPEQSREMGLKGREKVKKRFSPDQYYEGLLNIYRKVLFKNEQ